MSIAALNQQLATYAQESLLLEAVLTPKPGLVDAADTGAHRDMSLYTFLASGASLYPGFYHYAQAGSTHDGELPDLFTKIRPLGQAIEQTNLHATKGVNTHKGAIFSFGILLASAGYYLQVMGRDLTTPLTPRETATLFQIGQAMVQPTLLADFEKIPTKKQLTHGEQLYVDHGLMGIRGEAINGYPVIQEYALPLLREKLAETPAPAYTEETYILLQVLLTIMAKSEDSNIISRGGLEALPWCQTEAAQFLDTHEIWTEETLTDLAHLNEEFIARNLSPGGSADLLALTIFLAKLEGLL